jgi:hypothetical protein
MITGRRRPAPASQAAFSGVIPASRLLRAKVTMSTELAVATPRHMIAPIMAGTLKVVAERNRPQATPASAPISAVRMMNGSSQLWKFTTSSR